MRFCQKKGMASTEADLGVLMSVRAMHREETKHKVHKTESDLELQNS